MNKHNIFRFNVSVQDFTGVQSADGVKKVPDDESSALLWKFLALGNDVIELPIAAELHDDEEVLRVMEESIVFDNVGVVAVRLYLQLADKLRE